MNLHERMLEIKAFDQELVDAMHKIMNSSYVPEQIIVVHRAPGFQPMSEVWWRAFERTHNRYRRRTGTRRVRTPQGRIERRH